MTKTIKKETLILEKIIEIQPATLKQIYESTEEAKTTIYDGLTRLINRGKIRKYSYPKKKKGRPVVYYCQVEFDDDQVKEKLNILDEEDKELVTFREKRTQKAWTANEITFLKNNYERLSHEQIAQHVKRTVYAVRQKLSRIELLKEPHEYWTEEEKQYLKENYPKLTIKELMDALNRSELSIYGEATRLNLTKDSWKWEQTEIDYLKSHYNTTLIEEIAKHLSRTPEAVYKQARDIKLDLTKIRYKDSGGAQREIVTQLKREGDYYLDSAEKLQQQKMRFQKKVAYLRRMMTQTLQTITSLSNEDVEKLQMRTTELISVISEKKEFKRMKQTNFDTLVWGIIILAYEEEKKTETLPFEFPLRQKRKILKRRSFLKKVLQENGQILKENFQ